LEEDDWLIDIKADKGIQGIPKNITNFDALWDENNLYIGVRVYDTNVRFDDPSNRPYMNDGIELFLNPSNSKASEYAAYDKQLFITRINDAVYNNGAGYLSGWDTFDGGYTCEFAIPWSSMGISNPTDGLKIGFDIQNDDREQTNTGVTRESQIIWSGTSDNWQNTSKFGTLILDENYILEVGAPVAGGMGQTQTVTINGSNVSSKYLAVQYLEGTGIDAKIIVFVINASSTVTLSYPNTGTVLDVWLTDGFPNLVDESLSVRIYNPEP